MAGKLCNFVAVLYEDKHGNNVYIKTFLQDFKDKLSKRYPGLPVKDQWIFGHKTHYDELHDTIQQSKYLVILFNEDFMHSKWYGYYDTLVLKQTPGHEKVIDVAVGIQGFKGFPAGLDERKPPIFGCGNDRESWDALMKAFDYKPKRDIFEGVTEEDGKRDQGERKWKNFLIRNWDEIVIGLSESELMAIMDKLITKSYITTEEIQFVEREPTKQTKVRKLLMELENRPEEHIEYFVGCLEKSIPYLYKHIMEKDAKTQVASEKPPVVSFGQQATSPTPTTVPTQPQGEAEDAGPPQTKTSVQVQDDASMRSLETDMGGLNLRQENISVAPPLGSQAGGGEVPTGDFPIQAADQSLTTQPAAENTSVKTAHDSPGTDTVDASVPSPGATATPSSALEISPTQVLDDSMVGTEEIDGSQSEGEKVTFSSENILEDLIKYVQDNGAQNLARLRYEYNEDHNREDSRRFQEIIVDFTRALFSRYSVGSYEKVLTTCPEMDEEEYEAVGKIFLHGYKEFGYFPQELCIASIIHAIHGLQLPMDENILMQSFQNFITEKEAATISAVLKDKVMNDEEKKKILGTFSRFKVTKAITAENLKEHVLKCAKNQLLSKPLHTFNYMNFKEWSNLPDFSSKEKIQEFLKTLRPEAATVAKMLVPEKPNKDEQEAFEDLMRFVENLNDDDLRRFLHFTTGSDIVYPGDKIQVYFHSDPNRHAWFRSRTCALSLWIPTTYKTFNDFQSAFQQILYTESPMLKNWLTKMSAETAAGSSTQ